MNYSDDYKQTQGILPHVCDFTLHLALPLSCQLKLGYRYSEISEQKSEYIKLECLTNNLLLIKLAFLTLYNEIIHAYC